MKIAPSPGTLLFICALLVFLIIFLAPEEKKDSPSELSTTKSIAPAVVHSAPLPLVQKRSSVEGESASVFPLEDTLEGALRERNEASELRDLITFATENRTGVPAIMEILDKVLSFPISQKPDLDFWEEDVIAFPFQMPEEWRELGYTGHLRVWRGDLQGQVGIELMAPFAYPDVTWEGALRENHVIRASFSPEHQSFIMISQCEIDWQASRDMGLDPWTGFVPTGTLFGFSFDGRPCRLDYLGWQDSKDWHQETEIACTVSAELVKSFSDRLVNLKKSLKE